MSWSKKRHNRQSWAEEVIAAAMKIDITQQEVKPDEDYDEGIVSDESPASSSNDEIGNHLPEDSNDRPVIEPVSRPVTIKEKTRKEKVGISCTVLLI